MKIFSFFLKKIEQVEKKFFEVGRAGLVTSANADLGSTARARTSGILGELL